MRKITGSHAQAGVEGVINLRGRVLPVVDLAARLALGTTERARSARVVVVDGGSESIGLLVDGVSEVLRVGAADVEPPSATTTGDGPTAVLGVAKLGERLVLLLDLDAAVGGPPLGPRLSNRGSQPRRGSSASRTASPTKLRPSTVTNSAAPGPKTIHGACCR